MCWREYETGLNYLTNDEGESDYMCIKCPKEYQDKCHAQLLTPPEQARQDKKNLNRWFKGDD